jgi:hypothetical protein
MDVTSDTAAKDGKSVGKSVGNRGKTSLQTRGKFFREWIHQF